MCPRICEAATVITLLICVASCDAQYAILALECSAFAEIYGEVIYVDFTGILCITRKYNCIFTSIKRNIKCKHFPLTPGATTGSVS